MPTDLEQLVVSLEARIQQFENNLKRAEGTFDRRARGIENRQKVMERRVKQSFNRMSSQIAPSLTAIAATLSAREIIGYADAWTLAGNKVVASGTAIRDQADLLDALADTAVDTRSAFGGTIQIFSRLQRSTEDLGKSQSELLTLTETINKAFIVGGAAASESAAGILQLTQGLASGLLQGDELRSVRENAPLIAKAIADVFGVAIGDLKRLGAEGKITTEKVVKALELLGPKVDAAFAKTEITVGQALDNLETRFTQFVGQLSENGAMAGLAASIDFVADNLDNLAKAAAVAAALLGPAGLVAAAGAARTAIGALTVVVLANPLGALLAVLSAAAAAIYLFGDSSREAAVRQKEYNDALRVSTELTEDVKQGATDITRARAEEAIATLEAAKAEKWLALQRAEAAKARLETEDPPAFEMVRGGRGDRQTVIDRLADRIKGLREGVESDFDAIAALVRNLDKTFEGTSGAGNTRTIASTSKAYENAVKSITKATEALEAQNNVIDRNTFAVAQARKVAELLNAARRQELEITPALRAEIDQLATAYARAKSAADFEKSFDRIDEEIRALQREERQLGLTAVEADKLRFREDLLNEARRAGIPLTAALTARIDAAAEIYGRTADKVDVSRRAMENQISIADQLRQGMVDIGTSTFGGLDNIEDVAGRLFNTLAELTFQLIVMKPIVESMFGEFGTGFGGGSGGLGSLFAGFFANGGTIPMGQFGIAGENGPEPVISTPSGAKVISNKNMGSLSSPSLRAGGGDVVYNDNRVTHVDARQNDPNQERRLASIVRDQNRSFDGRSAAAQVKAVLNGGRVSRIVS